MKDFSQALIGKIDAIVDNWIVAVRQDRQIETAQALPYLELRDGIPIILQAIATILSQSDDNDIKTLVEKSLEHGSLRAKQGYDPEEIGREYRLLRQVIFSTLQEELVQGTSTEVMRVVLLINTALDEIITQGFKIYTIERLRKLEYLQTQLNLTDRELTRLVRASKDNMSHLAHELKNPLNSIIGYSDLFLRQQRKNSESNKILPNVDYIEKVLRNGRQLLQLIDDVLQISRYEAGKMPLHPVPMPVRAAIDSALEMIEPLAGLKKLKLVVECDRAPDEVVTDPLRFQQILTNLLSNAIRYTETGSIELKCQVLPDNQWFIAVTDTGIGIKSENLAQVFNPYFKSGNSNESDVVHSPGLGLAIVHRLVELLQGKIELVSQVGVGSTFTVILPLKLEILEETISESTASGI